MKSCIYYIYINSVRGIGRDFHRFSGPFCFFDDIMSLRREKRRFTNRKRIFFVWNEATKTEMWMKKREEKCNTARFHCMRCVLLKIAIFYFVHVPSVFFHHPLCLYFMNVPHHTREHDSLVAATTSTALYATAAAPLLLSLALSLSLSFSLPILSIFRMKWDYDVAKADDSVISPLYLSLFLCVSHILCFKATNMALVLCTVVTAYCINKYNA